MGNKLFYDTNALLELQELVFQEEFIMSQITFQEIENIKSSRNKDEEIKYKARNISKLLKENYGKYKIVLYHIGVKQILEANELEDTPDNRIISSAVYIKTYDESNLVFVSDDTNAVNIARTLFGLNAKYVDEIDIQPKDKYTGYKEVTLNSSQMSYLYEHKDENIYDCLINEYLIVHKEDGETVDILKWDGETYNFTIKNKNYKSFYLDKLKPKDDYQNCVMDSIYSNTVTAISGKAGSGKSLLSLMAAMNMIESGKYDRLVVLFNPTKVLGASDMGYYGGDFTEKAMQNFIGSVLTTKFGDRYAVDMLISNDKLKLVSMADCRGMEVRDNEILWITEAQNTSIELIKLCLSRVSSEAKVILEGDFEAQVDSYSFKGLNNGLKRVVDVFKGFEEFGYIELKNCWRNKFGNLCELL